MFKDKSILITGGTGSLGKALVTHLLQHHKELRRIIIFSRDEQKQFQMAQDLSEKAYPQLRYFIGDVRDYDRLERAFQEVDYVIHAAAMKHVHLAEYNPDECIKTNIGGAENVIKAALRNGVQRVIGISTDKAAAPVGVYGASKLIADRLLISANGNAQKTLFSVIRFGNFYGSTNSLIPVLEERKKKGLPFEITSLEATRFSISLEECVETVLFALENSWGGETWVPKSSTYKISDIIKQVDPSAKVEIVGLRPGEKVHEDMFTPTDALYTYDTGKYYVIVPHQPTWNLAGFAATFDAKKVEEVFFGGGK